MVQVAMSQTSDHKFPGISIRLADTQGFFVLGVS